MGKTKLETLENKMLRSHVNGTLPADLMMTPIEFYNAGFADKHYTLEEVAKLTQEKYYMADLVKPRLYAAEDSLDQELCLAAKERNIDIVILTHMVGSHQVVTEVLDARTRTESLMALVYID